MKLYELYELVSESQNLKVISSDNGDELGYYDGKNSIDDDEQRNGKTLNNCEIRRIDADDNTLIISVDDWSNADNTVLVCPHCLDYLRSQGYEIADFGEAYDYDEAEAEEKTCFWCEEVAELHEATFK